MWAGPETIVPNLFQPRIEPLCAYLALHVTSNLARPDKLSLLRATSGVVTDWDEVRSLLAATGLLPAAEHALQVARGEASGPSPDLLALRYRPTVAWLLAGVRKGSWRRSLRM